MTKLYAVSHTTTQHGSIYELSLDRKMMIVDGAVKKIPNGAYITHDFYCLEIPQIQHVLDNMNALKSNKQKIIDAYKNAVATDTKCNKFQIDEFTELDWHHGVCQLIVGFCPEFKFHISKKFLEKQPSGIGNLVYPVGQFHYVDNDVWTNELRWEYVDHMIVELNKMLKLLGA